MLRYKCTDFRSSEGLQLPLTALLQAGSSAAQFIRAAARMAHELRGPFGEPREQSGQFRRTKAACQGKAREVIRHPAAVPFEDRAEAGTHKAEGASYKALRKRHAVTAQRKIKRPADPVDPKLLRQTG